MIEQDEFNHIYLELKMPLYRRVLSMIRDETRAQEICQEAFLKAWEKRDTLEDSGNGPRWIYRIAVNLCLDELRRRSRIPLNESRLGGNEEDEEDWDSFLERRAENPFPRPEEQVLKNELLEYLATAMEGLSPDKREMIDLVYVRELSLKDISLRLGIPYGTVKSRLHYSVKKLSSLFHNLYPEEDCDE